MGKSYKNGGFVRWEHHLFRLGPSIPWRTVSHMGVSENSVPLNPMVLLIIIPIKWLFHWEYTQHFQTKPYKQSPSAVVSRRFRSAPYSHTPSVGDRSEKRHRAGMVKQEFVGFPEW